MASLSSLHSISSASSSKSLSACTSSSQKTTQISVIRKQNYNHYRIIQCKASKNHDEDDRVNETSSSSFIDRRNMILGLGGLYGATSAAGFGADGRMAVAAPIPPPDLSDCGPASLPPGVPSINCCPPTTTKIIDFELPSPDTPLRVRPAAHLVDAAYIAKINKAYELMRALPDDDPRSFRNQANVHCAYCDAAYSQILAGYPNLEIQVHRCWLFFPFHRWYLYFHEKILGSLIGDPTFALPYWNWDSPAGMRMPSLYTNPGSALYDPLRDPLHQPPALLDLNYNGVDTNLPPQQLIFQNLTTMYRQMVSGGKTPTLFIGSPYRAGDPPAPGGGTIEEVPHGPVHRWTGDRRQPNGEDMGNFYSAARDPIFFAHHSNIDRVWTIWKSLGGRRRDFTDPDFLNASFIFYDEKKQLVRVTVKDSLEQENLRYKYQDVQLPWLHTKPKAPTTKKVDKNSMGTTAFPVTLDKTVQVLVKRPITKKRSKKEKEAREEMLVINGVEFYRGAPVKFDVFINYDGDAGLDSTACAGSLANVPHAHGDQVNYERIKTRLKLALNDMLEDLEAEDDKDIVVTMVPRETENGMGVCTIDGMEIQKTMTSFSFIPSIFSASSKFLSSCPNSSRKMTQIYVIRKLKYNHLRVIHCRTNKDHDQDNHENETTSSSFMDRRNMLLGLGGLYGATSAGFGEDRMSVAAPTPPPDISTCDPTNIPAGVAPADCCPPPSTTIVDFEKPSSSTPLRIRPAAHLVDEAYIAKYNKAYELMRALPDDDPRSFYKQANIHCAYCSDAFDQSLAGFPGLELQVHSCWLFLPFHRYYLYFHEKILGSLIDDPTFALPFWNWDSPAGMKMPSMYLTPGSALYDPLRDPQHLPPTIVDLNYDFVDSNLPAQQLITKNLITMYRQVVSGGKTPTLFLGSPYRAGDPPNPGEGTIELLPHNTVHNWTGDRRQPNGENMGNFYSAARDPTFYAHHANIDRIWTIWKSLGGNRKDFTDPDFLNAVFLFYDENKQLVRVTVKDCLEPENMRFKYQDVEIPWLQMKPKAPKARMLRTKIAKKTAAGKTEYPVILDKTVHVLVKRPIIKRRSKKEKEDKEEMLIISGIELDRGAPVKFDVYINYDDNVGPESSEYAGCFTNVPHAHGDHKGKKIIKTYMKLGINDILEDLDAEDDDEILVTLVPKYSGRVKTVVTIDNIEIQYD
ncbi:hypothetical protein MKX01_002688 [Papaver californicum]|nr:hypothetical protein MKX01_002688 [Papaver californicum]